MAVVIAAKITKRPMGTNMVQMIRSQPTLAPGWMARLRVSSTAMLAMFQINEKPSYNKVVCQAVQVNESGADDGLPV